MLHELAAGEPPFSAPSVAQLLQQISTAAPRPPSAANPAIPAMLDLIVAKALQKQPDARYQSAAEMAADVRACLAELSGRQGTQAGSEPVTAGGEPPPMAAAVDVELEGTRVDGTLGGAATATLAGQGLALSLSRRFDSTEAFLLLSAGPGSNPAAGPSSKLPLSLRVRGALTKLWLEPAWPVLAEALLVAGAFAVLIAYSP